MVKESLTASLIISTFTLGNIAFNVASRCSSSCNYDDRGSTGKYSAMRELHNILVLVFEPGTDFFGDLLFG